MYIPIGLLHTYNAVVYSGNDESLNFASIYVNEFFSFKPEQYKQYLT